MKKIFILLFLTSFISLKAQELNCRVLVEAQQVETTERAIFEEMETEFAQFLNSQKWTDDTFEEDEVINCNLIINISNQPRIGIFEASVQVLASRPVYGTNYETVLLNFADRDWDFEFVQSQPLQFNENTFLSNITSLLAYYAYIIIGMDYDSFSELGGNPYFDKAWEIVNNAQSTEFKGWKQFNSIRNRYWLVENLRNPILESVRKAVYTYHINGLDIMLDQKEEAENNILAAIGEVQRANQARPRSIGTIAFMDAKSSEIIKIFSETNLAKRRQAFNLLNSIDPARSDEYRELIE
ncbi:MAG: DUF4835 family protein [Bacteroidota bacterium]